MESILTITQLPLWYIIAIVALLGAVMASFVNVVAYRLHTNVTIMGRSRCFSCGTALRWYELFPIVSYVAQRGRCRSCGIKIPGRDFIVELIGASLYVLALFAFASVEMIVFSWLVISVLLTIAIYDIDHFIIPNELVGIIAVLSLIYFIFTQYPVQFSTVVVLLQTILIASGLYALLWKISKGRWLGFGDVKLAAALAPFLSPAGAFSATVLSFWIGAGVGVGLIAISALVQVYQAKSYTGINTSLKSEIPFAPFIVAAFLLVYMYGINVLSLFTL